MNRLQQAWIWIKRIGHCRGFGIQSPSDYCFVRYVINEHWPYYAYADIGKTDNRLRRKLGKLYFRLANFLQPAVVVDLVGAGEYLAAGCRKAVVQPEAEGQGRPALFITPADADLRQIMQKCRENDMLVVEDIGRKPAVWREVVASRQATVTFDLYYCGIALFSPLREKQNYIVNF